MRARVVAALAVTGMCTVLIGCSAVAPSAIPARSGAPSSVGEPADRGAAADPTVVTIGDSIMKGHGLNADQAWPALMAARDDWRLDNLACDGAGFLAIGDDADCGETFAGLVKKAAALHPRTVIVEGSSNDFGQDDGSLAAETATQLRQLRAALPNAQIIGLSTIWADTAVPAQLADVDAQVREAVQAVGGTFVAVGQPLSGHPEWMQSDDVHPTAAGQRALFGAVRSAFDSAGVHA
jgi:acyl-CoA thioesterase-1